MVIVKIWGGLGNQLFQYSFGKYLSEKLHTVVKYDIQTTNNLNSFTQRDLAICHFNISLDIASEEDVNLKKYFRNINLARVERKIAQHFPFLVKSHIVESNTPRPFGALSFRDNCYYEGYWQSYKYLIPNEEMLRREFTLKQPASTNILSRLSEIESTSSVSIHVRRADYLSNKYFTVCAMSYYEKAIAHFSAIDLQAKFYIFTDDIDWCRANFIGPQYIFVTGNEHYEDLHLMSKCRHHIIANSTFSWWAAWCNKFPQKIVVAPKNWHKRHNEKFNDMLPEDWIKIE